VGGRARHRWVSDPADEELRKVLHHRAQLAMSHYRFDEAARALERLLSHDGGTARHVHGAAMLLDIHTIRMTDEHARARARAHAASELTKLCERLPTLALWGHAEAGPIRDAVPALRNAAGAVARP
jgi:hypothetical protein